MPVTSLPMKVLATVGAEHTPPQNILAVRDFHGPGVFCRHLFPDSLGLCKYLPADQRFMGVAYHDPVLRLGNNLLMTDIGVFALYHIAGVDLIRQNLPHGPGLPLAAASQFVVIAEQAAGSMIVARGHNAALVQPFHDHVQRNAVKRPLENLPDNRGRVLVDQQAVAVVRGLPVAIGWTRPHKLPVPHGLILLCPNLLADVGGVSLVNHIFQGHNQVIAAVF